MGRNWIPKKKVRCAQCGWTGLRGMLYQKCSRCGHYYPEVVIKPEQVKE